MTTIEEKIEFLGNNAKAAIYLVYIPKNGGKWCVFASAGKEMCVVSGTLRDSAEESLNIAMMKFKNAEEYGSWIFGNFVEKE